MHGVVAASLDESYPAVPENVAEIRHAVAKVAEGLGAAPERRDDIAVAVSEAAANVVVHAYRGRSAPGEIHVLAGGDEQCLDIVVSDEGSGLAPRPDSPGLGLGLPLMLTLASRVEYRVPQSQLGTELHLQFVLTS